MLLYELIYVFCETVMLPMAENIFCESVNLGHMVCGLRALDSRNNGE